MTTAYKSNVLQEKCGDASCALCEFLGGNHEVVTLLEVISILDERLAAREKLCFYLLEVIENDDHHTTIS